NVALKFFMVFASEEVFDMIYYFDCSSSQCKSYIYLSKEDLEDIDNVIYCDECDKSYKISDIVRFIKINFTIKELNEEMDNWLFDDNCTYDVLKRSSPSLKVQSPSSSGSQFERGEGDKKQELKNEVTLEEVVAQNELNNEPIIKQLRSISAFIHG
ncbi:hypothetical protein, partial [Paenibacillus odorifer]